MITLEGSHLGVLSLEFRVWSCQVPRGCYDVAVSVAVLLVFVRRCLVVALDIKVDRLEVRVVLRCGVVCCEAV